MAISIRSYLSATLALGIVIAAAAVAAAQALFAYKALQSNIDAKLLSTAANTAAFIKVDQSIPHIASFIKGVSTFKHTIYNDYKGNAADSFSQILPSPTQIQIWDKDGKPILQIGDKPTQSFSNEQNGLFELRANSGKQQPHHLKVIVYKEPTTQFVIAISQPYNFQDIFSNLPIKSLLISLFVGLLCFSSIFSFATRKLINSTAKLTREIKGRLPTKNLALIDANNFPKDFKPLIDEFNAIILGLRDTLAQEKRFAADAAHELKTPLAALKIQAQVALHSSNQEELQTALINIIKSVDRSTHVINQLLLLIRTLQGITAEKTSVSLNREIIHAITDLLSFAKQKNIELELIAPEQPKYIFGNQMAIGILIKNLIDNAIRYTPPDGLVQILIESADDKIILRVIDNGTGIPEELREKVFERFFRILGSQENGCGLGLSIVKQVAQQHNAEVRLVTPTSGQGLEVVVTFNTTEVIHKTCE